jgi:hypothetical protein
VEALGDAVAGDLDAVGIFRLKRAVLEGVVEEVDYGERKALVRVGGLEEVSVGGELRSGFPGVVTILMYGPLWLVLLLSGSVEEGIECCYKKTGNLDSCEGRSRRFAYVVHMHVEADYLSLCSLRLRGGAFGGAGAFEDIVLGCVCCRKTHCLQ